MDSVRLSGPWCFPVRQGRVFVGTAAATAAVGAAVSATSCWLAASCCTAAIALTATDAAAAAAVPPAAPAVCPAECATKSCNGSSSGSSKPTAASSSNQQALKKWKKRIFPPTPTPADARGSAPGNNTFDSCFGLLPQQAQQQQQK